MNKNNEQDERRVNILAVFGLILGIFAIGMQGFWTFFLNFRHRIENKFIVYIAIAIGAVAVLLSVIGAILIYRSNGRQKGYAQACAGIMLGIAPILIFLF